MTELIKFSFIAILFYLIILIFIVISAGFVYDKEKKKNSKNYDGNHSFGKIGEAFYGHFKIPTLIKDNDPKMAKYVTKYNRLVITYWISYLIGIPLLIYLVGEINKL